MAELVTVHAATVKVQAAEGDNSNEGSFDDYWQDQQEILQNVIAHHLRQAEAQIRNHVGEKFYVEVSVD